VLGGAFDPEGIVVHPKTGNLIVSDEYGASVMEFTRSGQLVRSYTIPENIADDSARRLQLRPRRQQRRAPHQPRLRRPRDQSERRVRVRDAAERDGQRGRRQRHDRAASSSSTARPARPSASTPIGWKARARAAASRHWSRSTTTSSWSSSATTAARRGVGADAAEQEGLQDRPERRPIDISAIELTGGTFAGKA
jgi:hypothetical protein